MKNRIIITVMAVLFTALMGSCKKENDNNDEVRIDSYDFKWTGINDLDGGNYSSFALKLTVHDPLGKLNSGFTWVETVAAQSPNSFHIYKPVNNEVNITGKLRYGGPSSTNTVIPYRIHFLLNDSTQTNEIKFDAIRQPGAN